MKISANKTNYVLMVIIAPILHVILLLGTGTVSAADPKPQIPEVFQCTDPDGITPISYTQIALDDSDRNWRNIVSTNPPAIKWVDVHEGMWVQRINGLNESVAFIPALIWEPFRNGEIMNIVPAMRLGEHRAITLPQQFSQDMRREDINPGDIPGTPSQAIKLNLWEILYSPQMKPVSTDTIRITSGEIADTTSVVELVCKKKAETLCAEEYVLHDAFEVFDVQVPTGTTQCVGRIRIFTPFSEKYGFSPRRGVRIQ
jgi:hypothetical protein